MTGVQLAIIAVLVLVNGFFVAAEFALVSARPQDLAERRTASARLVRRQVGRLSEYLAACQLGITIASLALGALGEPTLARLLEPVLESTPLAHLAAVTATVLALLVMTALHITIGEQAPKSFAIGSATRVALLCAPLLEVFHRTLRPLVLVLNAVSNGLVRAFGGSPAEGHGHTATLDELRQMIGEATRSGEIDRVDARLLHGAFTLDERRASEAMTPSSRLVTAVEGETAEDVLRRALEQGRSRLPLLDPSEESLRGVVYQRELAQAVLDGRGAEPVETLRHDMLIAPETLHLDRLLQRFKDERASICAVLDEYGSLVGVVTVEDVLEEVVGEIEDESDRPAGLRALRSGALVCPGDTHLVDLRANGIDLGEARSESVGGLVVERLGRLAQAGDTVEVAGRTVRVLSVDGRRVNRVLIGPPPPPAPEDAPDDGDAG